MPRHWCCSKGHSWTEELGGLLNCPICSTADVFEIRKGETLPPIEPTQPGRAEPIPSTQQGLPDSPASGEPFVQPETVFDRDAPADGGDKELKTPSPDSIDEIRKNLPKENGPNGEPPKLRRFEVKTFKAPEIPGYSVLGVLGRGGMGVVYKAIQMGLNRTVALKMISSGAGAGPHDLARFRQEAEALGRLQHLNIVQIYEVGSTDGLPFLALEFVDGGSLHERANGKPMPPRAAASILAEVADGIQCAHDAGIIHRDLKPANILFQLVSGDPGRGMTNSPDSFRLGDIPKVTDFGLAKIRENDSSITRTGAILGTPSFMSPEQAQGLSNEIGPATDIHALGAILYEMLTGRPPFLGADPTDTIMQVRSLEPIPPSQRQLGIPRDLETICLKCLEKPISKRYRSARELAADLRRYLSNETILARPTPAWERAIKWIRRYPLKAATIGLASLLLLTLMASGFALAWSNQRRLEVVERLNSELREESDRTKNQLVRADQNFGFLRRALDTLLTRFGDAELRDVPAVTRIRSQLLEQATRLYEESLPKIATQPDYAREAGWAMQRSGRLHEVLSENDKAEQAYDRAVQLFSQLVELFDEPRDQRNLAESLRQLAGVLEFKKDTEAADVAYQKCREIFTRLAAKEPQNLDYQLDLGSFLNNLGVALIERGQTNEAQAAFATALQHLQKLSDREGQLETSRALTNRGAAELIDGSVPEAELDLKKASDLLSALLQASPDDQRLLAERARAANISGVALIRSGRLDAALAAFQAAANQFQSLSNEYPSNIVIRLEYARQQLNLARLVARQKRPEALVESQLTCELFRELADRRPARGDFRLYWATALIDHALNLATAGDRTSARIAARDATEILTKLEAVESKEPRVQLELARSLANFAKLCEEPETWAEGLESLARATRLMENQLTAQSSPERWRDLANVYLERSILAKRLDKPRDVAIERSKAIATLNSLIQQVPGDPDAPADLARIYAQLAAEQPAESETYWPKAIEFQTMAIQRDRAEKNSPRQAEFEQPLGQYLPSAVRALLERQAVTAARKLCTASADSLARWPGWVDVAVLFSESCSKLPEDARKACGEEALNCLRRAIAQGFRDAKRLRDSKEFQPLRDDPQFRSELESLAASLEPGKK